MKNRTNYNTRFINAGFFIAMFGVSLLLISSPIFAKEIEDNKGWLSHGYDIKQTRHNIAEDIITPSNVSKLKKLWSFEAESGITGAPIVCNERVFIGSWDGFVYAFDKNSGDVIWKHGVGVRVYPPDRKLGIYASLAVWKNTVYIACDRLLALDSATGKIKWERYIGNPEKTHEYFWAPPLVYNNRLYAGISAGSETTSRGRIVCVNAGTGEILWDFYTVDKDVSGGSLIAPPSFDAQTNTLYAATGNPFNIMPGNMEYSDSLIALNAKNGKLLWADQVHSHDVLNLDLNCAPMLIDISGRKIAIVGGKDGIRAWDLNTHKRLWHRQVTPPLSFGAKEALPTNGPEGGPSAVAEGLALFASNNNLDKTTLIVAIDIVSGNLRWLHSLPAYQFGPMSVAGGIVFMGLTDGKIRGWKIDTGELLWESSQEQPFAGGLSIADGMLFAGTGAGEFLPGNQLIAFGLGK